MEYGFATWQIKKLNMAYDRCWIWRMTVVHMPIWGGMYRFRQPYGERVYIWIKLGTSNGCLIAPEGSRRREVGFSLAGWEFLETDSGVNWKFYPKKHLRKGCGRGFEAWYAFLHRVFVICAMPSSLTPLLRLAWGTKISMERIFRQLPAEPPPFSPTIRYPASFSAWPGKATLQKRLKSTVLLKRLDLPKRWSARWICQHQQMPGKNWSFLCTSVEYTTRWYKSATMTLNCCGPWGNAICHQDEASCRAQWVWIKMVSQEFWWLKPKIDKQWPKMSGSHALQFWPVPICTLGLEGCVKVPQKRQALVRCITDSGQSQQISFGGAFSGGQRLLPLSQHHDMTWPLDRDISRHGLSIVQILGLIKTVNATPKNVGQNKIDPLFIWVVILPDDWDNNVDQNNWWLCVQNQYCIHQLCVRPCHVPCMCHEQHGTCRHFDSQKDCFTHYIITLKGGENKHLDVHSSSDWFTQSTLNGWCLRRERWKVLNCLPCSNLQSPS